MEIIWISQVMNLDMRWLALANVLMTLIGSLATPKFLIWCAQNKGRVLFDSRHFRIVVVVLVLAVSLSVNGLALADTPTISFEGYAFSVVAQSPLDPVTTDPNSVNQLVIQEGRTVVIVAHNGLAGSAFYSLEKGSVVTISGATYVVSNVTVTGPYFSMSRRFFRQKDKIVLITCYEMNGDLAGGRRVVTGVRQP